MNVKVENLSFSYGKNLVLNGVDFQTHNARKIAIFGENGVGKTTLLKCICALEKYSGNIFLDGKNVKEIKKSDLAKIIAYLPQNQTLGDSTVFDTVLTGRRPYVNFSVSEEDYALVEEALQKLDISRLAFKRTDKLSGGEMQKVALARVLVQKPKLLILDESSSNLDIKNKIGTSKLISDLCEKEQITVLTVMHDLNSALSFADCFVILKDGKVFDMVEKSDLTEEILSKVFDTDIKIFIKEDGEKFVVY